MSHLNTIGHIYLIKEEFGLYKTGRSQNLDARLRSLELSYPYKLVLVHVKKVSNLLNVERALHLMLKTYRVKGEWYNLPSENIWFDALETATRHPFTPTLRPPRPFSLRSIITTLDVPYGGIRKLTDEQIRTIRTEPLASTPLRSIGRQFSVSYQTISNIRRRKSWKDV